MPKISQEEIDWVNKHTKTPNEQLGTPSGHCRVLIPGKPSLPLKDNNNSALEMIAKSFKGSLSYDPDKYDKK